MTAPIVIGLDLSLAATGACWRVSEHATPTVETWKQKPVDGDRRLRAIADMAVGLCLGSDLVVIEGPVNRSPAASIIGMVQGAVRSALIGEGIGYSIVSPATLKKFATGKGTASKADMAVAAIKRGGMEFGDDNQCDAWWLWVAGMTRVGHPLFELPAAQLAALGKVEWTPTHGQAAGL